MRTSLVRRLLAPLALSLIAPALGLCQFTPLGDVNQDGVLDVADLILVNELALAGGDPIGPDLVFGDVDDDGDVDGDDVDRLRRIITDGEDPRSPIPISDVVALSYYYQSDAEDVDPRRQPDVLPVAFWYQTEPGEFEPELVESVPVSLWFTPPAEVSEAADKDALFTVLSLWRRGTEDVTENDSTFEPLSLWRQSDEEEVTENDAQLYDPPSFEKE